MAEEVYQPFAREHAIEAMATLARVAELEAKAQRLANRIGYKPFSPQPATAWELLEAVVDSALRQWADDIVELHGLRARIAELEAALKKKERPDQ